MVAPTHRWRRGRLVEIPEEWRGQTTHEQTIRKRPSKTLHKNRKLVKYGHERRPKPGERAGMDGWTE